MCLRVAAVVLISTKNESGSPEPGELIQLSLVLIMGMHCVLSCPLVVIVVSGVHGHEEEDGARNPATASDYARYVDGSPPECLAAGTQAFPSRARGRGTTRSLGGSGVCAPVGRVLDHGVLLIIEPLAGWGDDRHLVRRQVSGNLHLWTPHLHLAPCRCRGLESAHHSAPRPRGPSS